MNLRCVPAVQVSEGGISRTGTNCSTINKREGDQINRLERIQEKTKINQMKQTFFYGNL